MSEDQQNIIITEDEPDQVVNQNVRNAFIIEEISSDIENGDESNNNGNENASVVDVGDEMDDDESNCSMDEEEPNAVLNEDQQNSEAETNSMISEKIKYGAYKLCSAEKNGKALKSSVWEVFRYVLSDSGQLLQRKIACKQCFKVYNHTRQSGYKYLRSHIENCPKRVSELLTDAQKKILKKEFKKDLCQYVCQDLQTLSSIKGGGMKHIGNRLIQFGAIYGDQITYDELCSHPNTISKHISVEADEKKDSLIGFLKDIQKNGVSIGVDLWKDKFNSISYLGCNLHYIHEGEMKEHTLTIQEFEFEKKDGPNISATLIHIFNLFDIDCKNVTFVSDRGSNIKSALNHFGPRLDCGSHMVNSVATHMLKTKNHANEGIKETLEGSRELVTYFKRAELQNKLRKTLKAEGATRWNGTLMMLESIFDVWDDIKDVLKNRDDEHLLETIDKTLLKEIIDFLKPFEEASKQFQYNTKPTLHLVVLYRKNLLDHARQKRGDSDAIKKLKELCTAYIEKKWILSTQHKLALFLHPQMRKLNRFAISERSEIIQHARELVELMGEVRPDNADREMPIVNKQNAGASTSKKRKLSVLETFMDEDVDKILHEDEIDRYIHHDFKINEDEMNGKELDLCKWWENRKEHFPNLYRVFLKNMCIPAGTGTMESKFSLSGLVLCQRRTRLLPQLVDDILFLNSHYRN